MRVIWKRNRIAVKTREINLSKDRDGRHPAIHPRPAHPARWGHTALSHGGPVIRLLLGPLLATGAGTGAGFPDRSKYPKPATPSRKPKGDKTPTPNKTAKVVFDESPGDFSAKYRAFKRERG